MALTLVTTLPNYYEAGVILENDSSMHQLLDQVQIVSGQWLNDGTTTDKALVDRNGDVIEFTSILSAHAQATDGSATPLAVDITASGTNGKKVTLKAPVANKTYMVTVVGISLKLYLNN